MPRFSFSAALEVAALLMLSPADSETLLPLSYDILRITGNLLLEDRDPDSLCQAIFPLLREVLHVDVYFHYLLSPEGDTLELASAGGNPTLREMVGSTLALGEAVCGNVAQCGRAMNLEDVQKRSDSMTSIIRAAGTHCYFCCPLIARGEVLGTLSFGSTRLDRFSQEETHLLSLVAQQVALATARRKQAQYLRTIEQLAAAGRMSATLAHEINNPLDSVRTVLYLLRDELHSPTGQALLQTAEAQIARIAETSRRTLETFRGSAAVPAPVNLSELVTELCREVRLPRDISLVPMIEPGVEVKAVAGELRQVLFNLLLNAAQFSPTGGTVGLTVARAEHLAELRIRDDGPGISEEQRTRIFEPFYTTRAQGGTGIGLWLSHEMIERSGGNLTFVSDPELRPGTEFILTLPLGR
ncbi:MAG: GAF domain-containing sensor histidine kinase [Acidobacteriaceae bacterium]|nr:GAF domain-containing sensor histidine kinase [Acidobacteriaceae bacterium]